MKKLFKALGTIAMLVALVLSFAACDDLLGLIGDDKTETETDTYKPVVYTSYDADGTKYELTITRTSRAVVPFTPAAGDSYTLTITTTAGATYTSTGQIAYVYATTFTLKHTGTSETFSVTVNANSSSGGTMVSITGDIPINNSATKIPNPGELTQQSPGSTDPTIPTDGSIDTWSNVTSFSQVNGSWKAQPSYSATTQGMTFSATTDNYIITFNAAIKTMSVSGSATTTISGGDINELWPDLKESMLRNANMMGGSTTITFDDSNHSYTLTYNNFALALADSELAQMGLQIYQDGSKLKMATAEGIEVIYTKQSSTDPGVPDISLTGTTWKAEFEDIVEAGWAEPSSEGEENGEVGETYEIRGKYTYILTFTNTSTFTMSMNLVKETGEEEEDSTNGTYMVSGNIFVLHGDDLPPSGMAGVINGDTLVLSGLITFTKQQ